MDVLTFFPNALIWRNITCSPYRTKKGGVLPERRLPSRAILLGRLIGVEVAVTVTVNKHTAFFAVVVGTSKAFAQIANGDSDCKARVAEGLSACVYRFRSGTDKYTWHSSVFGDAEKKTGFHSV